MGDSNKQVCRLCLELTPDSECENIEETEKDMLESLLINIDLNICNYPVACNRCLQAIQDCSEFKSRVASLIDSEVDSKDIFQRDILSNENLVIEKSQVCRLCASLIEAGASNYTADTKEGVLLKNMMIYCLPEVDLNTNHEPLLCEQCLSRTKKYYEFLKSCHEVEQRIVNHYQVMSDHGSTGTVVLGDILNSKYDTLGKAIAVKQECDLENDVNMCPINEDAGNIKFEEVDIKDEFNVGLETKEDCNSYGESASSKRKKRIRKSSSNDKKTHKCGLCAFVTDTRLLLRDHMTSHKGANKAYGCPECPFEADLKAVLAQHILKHRDDSEVAMHQCLLCPYKSKYKSAMVNHQKGLHDKNVEMFKCEECSFSTKRKASMKTHQWRKHRKQDEISTLKCEMCEFETEHKPGMEAHMAIHQVEQKFKCEKCPYECKKWHFMMRHAKEHEDQPDQLPYRCDECSYSCNYRRNLERHVRIHQKDGERKMYKCKLCSFQAKTSATINVHMTKTHTNPPLPLLQCSYCSYETAIKKSLSAHIRRQHGDEDQRLMYKCELCSYQAKAKVTIKVHMAKTHMDTPVSVFKCTHCSYETAIKEYLEYHMRRRHGNKNQQTYKCKLCSYRAKARVTIKVHMAKAHVDTSLPIYKCAQCPYETTIRDYLLGHMKRQQHGSKNQPKIKKQMYKCELCAFQARSRVSIKVHMAGIHDVRLPLLKCTSCPYETNIQQYLSRHMRKRHGSQGQSVPEGDVQVLQFPVDESQHGDNSLESNLQNHPRPL